MSLTLYTSRSSTPIVFNSTQTTQHYVCLALTPPRISHSSGIATYVVYTGKRDTDIDQLHLEKQFVVKIGTTAEQISLLLNEASIYTGALEGFKHAPEFYGVFSGYVGGEKALCEMLEFCGGGCVMDQDELNRQTILAVCSLHTARGILHGRLSAEHPQHIIPHAVAVFFQGALTVALPTIGNELKFTQEDLQWPLNVYSLAYACSVLFFGRLGDIVGGRVMFLAGSAWFAIWSLLIPFAPTSGALIAFVALTGIGAAANTPSGVGLLATFFPPGPKRNAAYGVMGAGQPLGFILGLLLGGVLTQSKATWRAGFYMQCGLAVFFVFLGFTFIVHQRPPRRYNKGLDWGGVLLSSAGLGMLIYSLADSTTARKGWSTPQIPSLFTGSALILALFIFYERYREARGLSVIVPMNIWNVKLASVLGTLFFSMWSFNLMIYYSTLYYQQINLLTPLQTAVRYIPMTIAGFLVNLIAGSIMSRVQGQPLILVGLLGSIVAPIIFATLNVHGSYWATMFLVMVITTGPDVVYPVGNLYLSTVFDDDSQALAAGLFAIAMRLGTSLGLAVTSSIATATSQNYQHAHAQLAANSPEVLMVGYRAAGWTLMAAGIVAFAIAAFGLRGIGIVGRAKEDTKDVVPQLQVAAAAGIELAVLPGASGGVVSSASSEKADVSSNAPAYPTSSPMVNVKKSESPTTEKTKTASSSAKKKRSTAGGKRRKATDWQKFMKEKYAELKENGELEDLDQGEAMKKIGELWKEEKDKREKENNKKAK
uniref:Major facilitator superfamily (MFS) profile domain-containing protein n=1 Tax=Mycena chlorophos TaxID=658473 RepID=A0ABQ0L8L1_MYCCL|nr:predicted protein [Mycena chlorophos]